MQQKFCEHIANTCITPTLKLWRGSVMVSGTFANCKVGDLHQVKDKLNQTSYHSILQHHMISSRTWLVGQRFVILQDNDPKYTSKLCTRYIKSKEEQHVLQLMFWSEQSMGLNPIEKVWEELDQKFKCSWPLATLTEKPSRTIFSLPPVFGGKNAENLWGSDSSQRIKNLTSFFGLIWI